MKTYPYTTPDGIIQLVELAELEKVKLAAIGLEAECSGLRADVQECNERLTKQQADMLDTIVKLRAELTSWQAMAERLATSLNFTLNGSTEKNQAPSMLAASQALAAYESAKKGELSTSNKLSMFTPCESCEGPLVCSDLGNCYIKSPPFAKSGNLPDPLAEAVKRMEVVDILPSIRLFTTLGATIGETLNDFRARLIQAAKGGQP